MLVAVASHHGSSWSCGRVVVVVVIVILFMVVVAVVVVVVFGLPVIGQGGRQANFHTGETAARQGRRTLRKISCLTL